MIIQRLIKGAGENTPAPGAVENAPPGRLFHPGWEQSNKLTNRQNLNINF
jgi:hypothetical protein